MYTCKRRSQERDIHLRGFLEFQHGKKCSSVVCRSRRHTYTHTGTLHAHASTHTRKHPHTHTRKHAHICINTHLRICTRTHTHSNTHISIYEYCVMEQEDTFQIF